MNQNNPTSFKVLNSCPGSSARTGELFTHHGIINTPVFSPVASQGSVKALIPQELLDIDIEMVLSNTYHLYLRPGIDTISKIGGLHKFMNWHKPILTDSGGYQVYSLSPLCKIDDAGVIFRSHIDGSEHSFTPENVIEFQNKLGVDIIMVLDECTSIEQDKSIVRTAMQRTGKWASRCKQVHRNDKQLLFAIVQGGIYEDLRKESVDTLTSMDFPGYAIGGLSLGETKETTWLVVELTTKMLPVDKPRYLMGVGSPEDILHGIDYGIDIFDSALPTRVARNGALFTASGRKNITKAYYRLKDEPIDTTCDCYTCRHFSAAYLNHLFRAGELLAYRLATIHNLRFISNLVKNARAAINNDSFTVFKQEFISGYRTTDESTRVSQKKMWLNTRHKSADIE
jgi:queuine tRNA-ribosyltransferase